MVQNKLQADIWIWFWVCVELMNREVLFGHPQFRTLREDFKLDFRDDVVWVLNPAEPETVRCFSCAEPGFCWNIPSESLLLVPPRISE